MATLTVWRFDSPGGADDALMILERLAKEELIMIQDAATVSWPAGKKKPKTHQLTSLTAGGALGGAFWGMLFGLLFFIPLLGMAIGAAVGGIGASLADVGIDDEFIEAVRKQVQPGTSALFVLSTGAVVDKVKEAFAAARPELIQTNLSTAQEAQLREAFAED